MAITWSGHIQIEASEIDDACKHPITDSGTPGTETLVGIIHQGILPIKRISGGTADVTTDWYARTTASGISGYRKLLDSNGISETIYACTITQIVGNVCNVEEFATDAGAMDGVDSDNETTTFIMRARWSKNLGIDPPHPFMVCHIYHRTAADVETEIASFSKTITIAFDTYTQDVAIDQAWGTDERLVIKYVFSVPDISPI